MKKFTTIILLLFITVSLPAQVSFKTVVPQKALVVGESFQVQYTMQDGDDMKNFRVEAFPQFRIVTGPVVYYGSVTTINGIKPLSNSVFTLVPLRTGRYVIPGATAIVDGELFRSNDAIVDVISREEAIRRSAKEGAVVESEYFLRPGEDPYQKISKNLFVKMMVDKQTCYVGEPIVATFKLYSRLESKSDIVKNPGFYGFTVYDMVNLADKQVATENINGKIFDVHTIRKVQLYPLRPGDYIVDPMQVKNKIEFSRSAVSKKTEQEIIEGVLGRNEEADKRPEGTDVFETDIKTEPVTIHVKSIPEKNKPSNYNGATGNFSITATVVNNKLKKNEEGFFEITITGKGNFIQLSAPAVQWPEGIEGFDPSVNDDFDKTKMPLAGTRVFRFPFVSSSAGTYTLPAVSFSFFDIDSNSFRTISTKAVGVEISNETKAVVVSGKPKRSITENSERAARIAGFVVLGAVLLILVYWILRKKEPVKTVVIDEPAPVIPTGKEILAPVYGLIECDNSTFYSTLYSTLWKYAGDHFNLSGSALNKQSLGFAMRAKAIPDLTGHQFIGLVEKAEIGRFTQAAVEDDRLVLLAETAATFDAINTCLFG